MFSKKDRLEVFTVADFVSLSGETTSMGQTALFIRLAGCNLRCLYCDTKYSQTICESSTKQNLFTIIDKHLTKNKSISVLIITGGEPTLQLTPKELLKLSRYVYEKYPKLKIQIETNGSTPIMFNELYEDNISFVIDYKLAGSGEEKQMISSNYVLARPQDEIKFVITDLKEWKTIIKVIDKYKIKCNNIWVSPVNNPEYKDFILGKKLWNKVATAGIPSLRMQVQLHKVVFPNSTKEV